MRKKIEKCLKVSLIILAIIMAIAVVASQYLL